MICSIERLDCCVLLCCPRCLLDVDSVYCRLYAGRHLTDCQAPTWIVDGERYGAISCPRAVAPLHVMLECPLDPVVPRPASSTCAATTVCRAVDDVEGDRPCLAHLARNERICAIRLLDDMVASREGICVVCTKRLRYLQRI